jgi:hypothetical protein
MQPTFDALGIELLKHGYRKVVFLEVECKIDGTYRLGVSAELPLGPHFDCPRCHVSRPCSGILAAGYSRRSLPLEPEFWGGAAHWQQMSEDEYRQPAPKPGMDGRARHYQKTRQVDTSEPEQSCAVV